MKRMTDERLAEIEVCHVEVEPVDITDTWFYFEELRGYTTETAHKQRGELLQALKAERAEVARLHKESIRLRMLANVRDLEDYDL